MLLNWWTIIETSMKHNHIFWKHWKYIGTIKFIADTSSHTNALHVLCHHRFMLESFGQLFRRCSPFFFNSLWCCFLDDSGPPNRPQNDHEIGGTNMKNRSKTMYDFRAPFFHNFVSTLGQTCALKHWKIMKIRWFL